MTALLLTLLAGCSGSDDDPVPPTEAVLPDLPPPACLDYSYLDLTGMGELVSATPDPLISYEPEGLTDILRVLGEEYSALEPMVHGVDAWQVRYKTQDRGSEALASTLVIVPRGVEGPLPVIVWMHPTVGARDHCAPSALGIFYSSFPLAFASRMGVAVVAPDFLGLLNGGNSETLHPYIVPEPTAISSLDAVRAASRLADQQGWELDTDQLLLWGVSQGGHAALWADRYQPGYAPELGVAGVVSAIPPTDLKELFFYGASTWSRTSETVPAVAAGMASWYDLALEDVLLPEVVPDVLSSMTLGCDILDPSGDLEEVSAVFTTAAQTAMVPEDWACALDENRIATSALHGSDAPMFMVLGTDDDLVQSPLVRADAESLCDDGAQITLLECVGKDHEAAGVDTLLVQESWIRDRIAGVAAAPGCDLPEPVTCDTP